MLFVTSLHSFRSNLLMHFLLSESLFFIINLGLFGQSLRRQRHIFKLPSLCNDSSKKQCHHFNSKKKKKKKKNSKKDEISSIAGIKINHERVLSPEYIKYRI